ncbi:alkylmercury lyase [Haloferax sp. Atlit-109R]|jgi:alkylmercury lyase|nr:alkylmercury lyase [Haloferax sp. Atlit-24N]RLM33203.1 alkylmercury lyase [Haloferax sp. Atlit-109R]RLM40657.1 alkylmercury lyase [Haloferax sp. Atlit-105R]
MYRSMSNQDCNCADPSVGESDAQTPSTDNWIEARPVKTAEFPTRVADNMSRFFGASIDTFDDMVAAIRTVVEGDGIAIDELCHVDGETPHYAKTASETYYFRCFYDGIALANLVDEPVEIRTETPTEEPIEIQMSPADGVDVTPPDAVMSFGVTTESDVPADETPSAPDVYGAVCPYVKAFYTREDYERWAADVAATTVGIPLDAGVPIAAALTAPAQSEGAQ